MPAEVDYAWAAGIIDGEGYLGMTANKAGSNRRVTNSFQIRLVVQMTCFITILRLKSIIGGSVRVCNGRNLLKHRKTYRLFLGDVATERALEAIGRYMTTKKRQAKLLIAFRKMTLEAQKSGKCSNDLVLARKGIYDQLREANKRGV